MRTKDEIRARIKKLRLQRNDDQQYKNTEGYVCLNKGAITALEWILGYKQKPKWWCYQCGLLHNNLKCPKCGNVIEHEIR